MTCTALGILGACGFKEPFIFPLLGASLLLGRGPRDWLYRFLLPLILALTAGLLLLLACGWLDDYVTSYLSYMAKSHVTRGDISPWKRGLELWHLWDDLNVFSWGLGWAFITLLATPFLMPRYIKGPEFENHLLRHVLLFFAGLYLTSLAVGFGGEYYNHHHVFMLPFALALWIPFLRHWRPDRPAASRAGALLLVWLLIATFRLPDMHLDERLSNIRRDMAPVVAMAQYVDLTLGDSHSARYTYLGGNGLQLYGWTTHSPQGPCFIQLHDFLERKPGCATGTIAALRNTDLVVVERIAPQIDAEVRFILEQDFTTTPQGLALSLPMPSSHYTLYFRKPH